MKTHTSGNHVKALFMTRGHSDLSASSQEQDVLPITAASRHLGSGLKFPPKLGSKALIFFFFFSFIFISWRLITLQYCSGFCHTLTWISHGFACVPHPDPPHTSLSTRSLWVFPVHQAPALVSCIQPGLAIWYLGSNLKQEKYHWSKGETGGY